VVFLLAPKAPPVLAVPKPVPVSHVCQFVLRYLFDSSTLTARIIATATKATEAGILLVVGRLAKAAKPSERRHGSSSRGRIRDNVDSSSLG